MINITKYFLLLYIVLFVNVNSFAETLEIGNLEVNFTTPSGFNDTSKFVPKEDIKNFEDLGYAFLKHYSNITLKNTEDNFCIILISKKAIHSKISRDDFNAFINKMHDNIEEESKNATDIINSSGIESMMYSYSNIKFLEKYKNTNSFTSIFLGKNVENIIDPYYIVLSSTQLYLCNTIFVICSYSRMDSDDNINQHIDIVKRQASAFTKMLTDNNFIEDQQEIEKYKQEKRTETIKYFLADDKLIQSILKLIGCIIILIILNYYKKIYVILKKFFKN